MISSEVQRTLVKSPPELWAELSDSAALARHLGELGEIRITHIEPEQAVQWTAQDISGTVLLKASGWGTKVTLSVRKEIPEAARETAAESSAVEEPRTGPAPAPTAERTEIETEPSPDADHDPPAETGTEIAPDPERAIEARSETVVDAGHEPEAQTIEHQPEPEGSRRLFSRLFRRSPRNAPAELDRNELLSTTAPLVDHLERTPKAHLPYPVWAATAPDPLIGLVATPQSVPEPTAPAELPTKPAGLEELLGLPEAVGAIETDESRLHSPSTDTELPGIAAELSAAEEVAAEQVTAVLTGVLDRLGAAHHRPFSRS